MIIRYSYPVYKKYLDALTSTAEALTEERPLMHVTFNESNLY